MSDQATVSPFQALLAAKGQDPFRKAGKTMPQNLPAPKGTGSFGRFIHDVGFLIDLFADPCQIDPFILIETSLPALLRAAYDIVSPDPKEVFHVLTGKSVVCTLKRELNERGTFDDFHWDGYKTTLFRTAEIADLAVWKLFVASVLTEGLIEWQSQAQELSGCGGARSPFSSHTADGAIPDNSNPSPGNGFEWSTGDPVHPAFAATCTAAPGENQYIMWCCQATFDGHNPVPITAYIEDSLTGAQVASWTSRVEDDGRVHPVVAQFRRQNTGNHIQSYTLRARALVPGPSHEAFFLKGFCAISPRP